MLLKRGELLRLAGHFEAALSDFQQAARRGERAGEADFQLGWTLLQVGRPAEARPHLDRYIAAHPDDSKAFATRARTLVVLDDNLAAAADFTRAIALSPVPDYYLERARALAAAGDVAAAVEGLDRGLERIGAVVSLQRLAIDQELARNNIDGAVARVDSMAGITGRADIWLARRGDILLQAGRRDDAHAAYGQALAAIETLSVRRQSSSAVRDLKTHLEAALRQLAGTENPTSLRGADLPETRIQ
ncbi:MAG: tetratricopeptide repeat protein [Inquilinus sp.]|nr:tetratricopeptide repeat protein [Inquilinus sp.]